MTPNFNAPATFHYITFYELLSDAIFQHRCAASETDSFRMNRYLRVYRIALRRDTRQNFGHAIRSPG